MFKVTMQRQAYFFHEDRLSRSPLVFCFREFLIRWRWDLRKKKKVQDWGDTNSPSTFYALFCLHSLRNHSPKTVKKTNSNHLPGFFFGEILFLCKQSWDRTKQLILFFFLKKFNFQIIFCLNFTWKKRVNLAHSSSGVMKVRGSGASTRPMRTQEFQRDIRDMECFLKTKKKWVITVLHFEENGYLSKSQRNFYFLLTCA